MKKTIGLLVLLLCITMIFSSCASVKSNTKESLKETGTELIAMSSGEKISDDGEDKTNETEAETKQSVSVQKEYGGGTPRYPGVNEWDESYITPPTLITVLYVGEEQTIEWWGWEDGVLKGSTYDYVRHFNVPRDLFEIATYQWGYYDAVFDIDLLFGDDKAAYDDLYLNHLDDYYEWHNKMGCEKTFISNLFVNDTLGDYPQAVYDIADEVLKKFPEDIYHGIKPDYTGIFSIPEIIYLNDLTKEEVYGYYKPLVGENTAFLSYDFDSIFNEREKYEKLIAEARAIEDPLEMLKATRAINEMVRVTEPSVRW